MNQDEFETIKEAFIERCEEHVSDPMTTSFAAKIYAGYADTVRKNGCLPDHKDSWATDAFAYAFKQVCYGLSMDTYQHYFDRMFPQH